MNASSSESADRRSAKPLRGGRVRYLFLQVRDLARSTEFYERIGFELSYADGSCAFLSVGDASGPQVALYPGGEGAVGGGAFFAIDVTDIESCVQDLRNRDVPVSDMREVPFGRAATINDPDGNIVEIHQPR